jgi:hypothetical protein
MGVNDMKKQRAGVLAAAIMWAVAGNVSANANPYADVPQGDWSYGAMAGLVHQGLVRGESDTTFSQSAIITRQDMAVLVAKAMSKESQMDAASKAATDKLVNEYARELSHIGVEDDAVAALQAQPAAPAAQAASKWDRLNFYGSGRLRFDHGQVGGKTAAWPGQTSSRSWGRDQHINLDLCYDYKLNDAGWLVKGESEYGRTFNYGGENETLQNSVFEQLYLTGPIGKDLTVRGGRYSVYSPLGMVYDDKLSGVGLQYSKDRFSARVDVGKATSTDDSSSFAPVTINGRTYTEYSSQDMQDILFDIPAGPKTNFHAGYYRIGGNIKQAQPAGDYVSYTSLGFDTSLAQNLRLDCNWSHSDAARSEQGGITSNSDNAYIAKVTYRGADLTKPGSFDIFALYRYSPRLASYSNTDDWVQNVKGWRIGGDYVVTKNMGFTTWYTFGKDIDTNEKSDMYRFQWNFLI